MKTIIYLFLVILIVACSTDGSGNANTAYENPIYLDANGLTIKAREWAEVGAQGDIDGITYTVIDEVVLRLLIEYDRSIEHIVTTKVTDMSYLFYNVSDFNKQIGYWDVSNVTDMSHMFYSASIFNKNISKWDVSNVTDMSYMFVEANKFNINIKNWDVSNVTNMSYMFYSADLFNKNIRTWNVSNVTDMSYMFSWTTFNRNLGNWDTDNVTNCINFSFNNPQWSLSKPNFTNCTP